MKKFICLLGLAFMFTGVQAFAAPPPPHGGMHARVHHRPPVHRHYVHIGRPIPPPMYYRPYYSTYYYPTTTYTYYYSEPNVQTVVVRDEYSGINTAANVINAAANVAATIRFLSW